MIFAIIAQPYFRVRDVTARVEDRFNFAFIFSFKPAIIPKPYIPEA